MTTRLKAMALFFGLGIFALTGCVTAGAESADPGSSSASADPTPPPPVVPTVTGAPLLQPASGELVSIITADVTASALEVTAIVVDVVDSDGVCTLTAARGDDRLTREVTVQAAPNGSYCGLMSIDRDELTSGTWEMQVSYKSEKTSGRSESKLVEVE